MIDCTQLLENPTAHQVKQWQVGQRGDLGYTWIRSIAAHALNHDALDPSPHARSQMRSIAQAGDSLLFFHLL